MGKLEFIVKLMYKFGGAKIKMMVFISEASFKKHSFLPHVRPLISL